jgi:hypothetical protein
MSEGELFAHLRRSSEDIVLAFLTRARREQIAFLDHQRTQDTELDTMVDDRQLYEFSHYTAALHSHDSARFLGSTARTEPPDAHASAVKMRQNSYLDGNYQAWPGLIRVMHSEDSIHLNVSLQQSSEGRYSNGYLAGHFGY